jgi:tRNA threonylcarbamoyl adenosine modification protein YeaZ
VILVIDTSSAISVMALIAESGPEKHELAFETRTTRDLPDQFRRMSKGMALTKVAVAIGPGSFTGLRVGVSFGLGLAMGLRIPIVPLRTLELQAARSDTPVISVSEAGRGRVYYLVPGEKPGLGEPAEIPKTHPLAGFVSAATATALKLAGHRITPDLDLTSVSEAARHMLESAREVPYGSLKLEYMQSFSASK